MDYQLIHRDGFVELTFKRPADLELLLQADVVRESYNRILVNLSPGLDMEVTDVHNLLVHLNDRPHPLDGITAILVVARLDYALSLIFEDSRNLQSRRVGVFKDREEAVKWLLERPPAG